MRELTLDPADFMRFSVPHALCLAGERQYALGLGAIAAAVHLRVRAEVSESTEQFRLDLGPDGQPGDAERLLEGWRQALAGPAAHGFDDLDGLHIRLDLSDTSGLCPPEVALGGPAVAVALACALRAHRSGARTARMDELAELACALMADLPLPGRPHPDRFYAQCYACLQGGALYVAPGAEPLNVQLALPPDCLILIVPPDAALALDLAPWEDRLESGLRKIKGAAQLVEETEADMSPLFEAAAGKLDDQEMAVLYGLLRVREMIQDHLEAMDQPTLDHDRFAELCDEESAILQDYLGFPAASLMRVREQAVESGALGARLTYIFGGAPGLIVIAPGRRDEVHMALAHRLRDCRVLPVDVDPEGVAAET